MRKILTIAAILLATTSIASANIAVTESINNAFGEDSGREWIELFNYGPTDINLTGWSVVDEDNDSYVFPGGTIPSGGYVIVVSGGTNNPVSAPQAKAIFEKEWLGGAVDSRVYGAAGMALGNSDDEIIVKDDLGNTVWNLAYANDEHDGQATWLTTDDFSCTDWGTKGGVQIDRSGDDLTIGGLIGYEDNNSQLDPLAWTSDYTAVQDGAFLAGIGLAEDFYDGVSAGTVGSPLAGNYTAAPEPATIMFLAIGSMALIRRRR